MVKEIPLNVSVQLCRWNEAGLSDTSPGFPAEAISASQKSLQKELTIISPEIFGAERLQTPGSVWSQAASVLPRSEIYYAL